MTNNVLIIDGFNIFVRSSMINQTTNASGDHYGGAIGFLNSLRSYIRTFSPEAVVVVWEQGGGSAKRKKIYPQYKQKRVKLNELKTIHKDVENNKEQETYENNRIAQLQLLTKALGCLPVLQLYIQDVEADDVIGYLIKYTLNSKEHKHRTKIVVTSDKDYYQLLDTNNVRIYDPAKHILIDKEYVKEHYNISCKNITVARSVAGDESDNIDGVPGIGLKTIAKRFPTLSSDETEVTVEDLISEAKIHTNSHKSPRCFQDIIDHNNIIRRNWELMLLDLNCFSHSQIEKIKYKLESFSPAHKHLEFIKCFIDLDIAVDINILNVSNELRYLVNFS